MQNVAPLRRALPAIAAAVLALGACSRTAAPPASAAPGELQARAARGDTDAMLELGRRTLAGTAGIPRDAAKARALFEAAAQRGSGGGLFELGLLSYAGAAVPGGEGGSDPREACALFRLSAAKKHPGGLREYGNCSLHGIGGTSRDPAAAAGLYRASIEHGGVQAYAQLAMLYRAGVGVPRDPGEGVRLLREGGDKGCIACLEALAGLTAAGEGVPADPAAAARLLERSRLLRAGR